MEFGLFTLFTIFIVCAIIDTIAPGILGATAYLMLMKSDKKIKNLILFLIFTQGSYFLLGITFMIGNESVIKFIHLITDSLTLGSILIVGGIILIIFSFALPKFSKDQTNFFVKYLRKFENNINIKIIILVALFIFLLEVTQAFPYWAVLGLMTYNDFSTSLWLPTLAVYNILMVLPSIILIFVYTSKPRKSELTLSKLKKRLLESNIHLWAIGGVGGIFFSLGINTVLNILFPH